MIINNIYINLTLNGNPHKLSSLLSSIKTLVFPGSNIINCKFENVGVALFGMYNAVRLIALNCELLFIYSLYAVISILLDE